MIKRVGLGIVFSLLMLIGFAFVSPKAWAATTAPTMATPASGASYGLIPVNFTYGEAPLTNSMTLSFVGSSTITISLHVGSPPTGPYEYFINPTDVMATGAPFLSTSQNTIPDGVYTVVLSYQNSNGDPAATVAATNVTVTAAIIDSDADGSVDAVEQAGPNNGDANNDGTADSEQPFVYSYLNPVTNNYAVLETNCETIENFQIGSESSGQPDPDYDYPMGLASFWIQCANTGDTARIRHYYYGIEGNEYYSVRKWMNDGSYREIPDYRLLGTPIDGDIVFLVEYEITDGGIFDDDGTQDAVIRDPSGAAVRTVINTSTMTAANTTLANTGINTQLVLGVALSFVGLGGYIVATLTAKTKLQSE